jgi:hypothetical protein
VVFGIKGSAGLPADDRHVSIFANLRHLATEELNRLEQASDRDFDLYVATDLHDRPQDYACKQMCYTKFLDTDVTGRHTLLHVGELGAYECMKHYLSCKAIAPENTSACIVVPRRVATKSPKNHGLVESRRASP